jgi:NADH-ubiquinone oxidoreductase chain 6
MYTVYLIIETYTNGYTSEFLDILSLISIIFGIFIIISKNPIVSVLFLIFLFSSVSIYLILLGINFIGISYLLVYVGAVSILFLFILMLINIRISELLSATGNSMPLAIIITISFYYPLSKVMSYNTANNSNISTSPSDILNINDSSYIISKILKYYDEISYTTSKN